MKLGIFLVVGGLLALAMIFPPILIVYAIGLGLLLIQANTL